MPIFKAPNNDTFRADSADGLPQGCVEITEEELTSLSASKKVSPSKAQRIAAKLQAGNFPTKGHLYYFIENMRTVASLKLGVTDAQAHAAGYAGNPMYRQMIDLYNEILAIEAEP